MGQIAVQQNGRRPASVAGIVALAVLMVAGGAALTALATRHPASSPAVRAVAAPGVAVPIDFETGGWGWRRVADPAPGAIAPIAGGYLGECVAGGLPTACTSKDGVGWTLPADPALLAATGSSQFGGWSVAHGSAGWVAVGTVDPGTWQSSDGVHWSAVAIDLPGLQRAQVQTLGGGFAMVALTYVDGQPAAPLLTSTDGMTWNPVELPAGMMVPQLAGAIGLVATRTETTNGSQVTHVVSSSDGLEWRTLALPEGVGGLSASVRLANGSYVAYGTSQILVSADGLTWTTVTGLGSWQDSMAVVGSRILAIAKVPNTDVTALWESTDATSWERVALLDGDPLSGSRLVSLGDRLGLFTGSKLTMVGFPAAGGIATASPRPTGSAGVTESPTPPPALAYVVGGWRWHPLSLRPDPGTTVVRVPNGYFGRCGHTMCASADGWSWQTPADPAIFSADSTAVFSPLSVAHSPGGSYVVNAAEGVWYSPDGVHWQPASIAGDRVGYRAVLYGPAGFSLVGSPEDSTGGKSRLFSSADGTAWTDAGLGPMVGLLAQGETSGGIVDLTGKSSTGGVFGYTADGRTWVTAKLPKNEIASSIAYRLPDGSLLVQGGSGFLHSADGRSWVPLKTAWQAGSLAVSGDVIITVANDATGGGTAWESTDSGRTFNKVMGGVASVAQFGNLVLLETANGGVYVGAPLDPSEGPGTTPTATGLPGASAPAPRYTQPTPPPGGISRDEAIRIATNAVHPTADQAAYSSAGAYEDPRYGRWVWSVSFSSEAPSPTGGSGIRVSIDYFTGEVLDSGYWIS